MYEGDIGPVPLWKSLENLGETFLRVPRPTLGVVVPANDEIVHKSCHFTLSLQTRKQWCVFFPGTRIPSWLSTSWAPFKRVARQNQYFAECHSESTVCSIWNGDDGKLSIAWTVILNITKSHVRKNYHLFVLLASYFSSFCLGRTVCVITGLLFW